MVPRRSALPVLQPRFRLIAYPVQRFKFGLEGINLFNRAIRPLGFDCPFLTVTEHYAEDGFTRSLDHSDFYRGLSLARKTDRLL